MITGDLFGAPDIARAADFPQPGIRRSLTRWWAGGPRALVIGCNPSTADGLTDDPTSKWWNRWFRHWGYVGYTAMNLYPFCTPSPAECRARYDEAIGGPNWHDRDALFVNLTAVMEAAKRADDVFVCWGAIAWDLDWIEELVEQIQTGVAPYPDLYCWGTTASGAPTHPMARGKHRIDPLTPKKVWRAAAR